MIPKGLTIAGSDPSGGAGIQADLKTFTVLDVYGMAVITALTAQNTRGVQSILPVDAEFVEEQLRVVLRDIAVDAVKTGMLFSPQTVIATARALTDNGITNLVVDPVLVAGSGDRLAHNDLPQALLSEIVPRALLLTPNIPEAAALTGIEIREVTAMEAAAKRLVEAGASACLVKGGHLKGDAVDVLVVGRSIRRFTTPRIHAVNTHGTGCQLSAAITAFLARGVDLETAVDQGKRFITKAIGAGLAIGHGPGPANPLAWKA